MLPEVTARVSPTRALSVPYPLGYPFGAPNDPALQRRILRRLIACTARGDVPFIEDV